MSLTYHPRQGEVLMCDYGAGGFIAPEMVKTRPIVVLSPKRLNAQTCLVVPLSTTTPTVQLSHHHIINPMSLPRALRQEVSWVKGDMVTHVAVSRLDRVRYRRSVDGRRVYESTIVLEADWRAIQICIRHSLGLNDIRPGASDTAAAK